MNTHKLLTDVFNPRKGERVVVMVDAPPSPAQDSPEWLDRRNMANEWRTAFSKFGCDVLPLLTYEATQSHGQDLPPVGRLGNEPGQLKDIWSSCDLVVAMTEFSATAPLISHLRLLHKTGKKLFRGASMPGVLRRMEQTAFAADYTIVAQRARILEAALNEAQSAELTFTTGHRVVFDLRFNTALADTGICQSPGQFINFPSGEAFKVPYEGHLVGTPSETAGIIPWQTPDGQLALLHVERNTIVEIEGENEHAKALRELFSIDPARRNIAELGLGCNDKAVVQGNTLEDEKVGLHWAFGRSEHLGGTVGPDKFRQPDFVIHKDIVYARGCPVEARTFTLSGKDGTSRTLIKDGAYTIW